MSNLATAIKIQEASAKAMSDETMLSMAANILAGIREGVFTNDTEEFSRAMFHYTGHVVAHTATLVSSAVLGESLFDKMVDEIQEMEDITREIETE